MKNLNAILQDVPVEAVFNQQGDPQIAAVAFDSRVVAQDYVFVAVKGTQADGHRFIEQAVAAGAIAVTCEERAEEMAAQYPEVVFVKVACSQKALGLMASNFYDKPSQKLSLTGVTGTNGKTTVVTLLYHLFSTLGYRAGLLSTIENKISGNTLPASHTTPDPVALNRLLHDMVKKQVSHCFMEVSSHAIDQNRIAGLYFTGAIFTNITQDHLDYHKTFKKYLYVKKRFFDELPKAAWAFSNADDKNGRIMLQNTKAAKHSYGLLTPASFKGKIIENSVEGLHMKIGSREVWFKLVGKFNAYNLLAVYGAATLLGESQQEVLAAMSSLHAAEGRFEVVESKGIRAVIDYAHTPDALRNVLETITTTRSHKEQLITVVGAGGDRDKGKRPLMAQIATKYSDTVILCPDNPRS